MLGKVIQFGNEPVVGCGCGCDLWRLITPPEKDKIPRKVIFFECGDCKMRIPTNIDMEV